MNDDIFKAALLLTVVAVGFVTGNAILFAVGIVATGMAVVGSFVGY